MAFRCLCEIGLPHRASLYSRDADVGGWRPWVKGGKVQTEQMF